MLPLMREVSCRFESEERLHMTTERHVSNSEK